MTGNLAKDILDQAVKVLEERTASYGDSTDGHENLGVLWSALIRQRYPHLDLPPLPAELVLLMMAANKLNRAALTGIREDDHVDGANYFALAYEAKRRV